MTADEARTWILQRLAYQALLATLHGARPTTPADPDIASAEEFSIISRR